MLLGIIVQSQDWQPFPLQQRTFWENGPEIKMYYNDQVDTLGSNSYQLYFGKQYYLEESDGGINTQEELISKVDEVF